MCFPSGMRGKRFKSLKTLGLDTNQPGVYTIYGLYMETGGPAKHGFGDDWKNPLTVWGGNIATNTIQVKVLPAP